MGDNEEGRPKLHERGSGLQVEGMPRPGKTTQGQELRRSASMRKSFKMVKNFWRQFEGPRTDPPRRRIIRTIEPEGPPPPPERPILRPIPRPTKGEVRGVDSEVEEESSRRSNAKGLIRTSQMQGKKPSTLRSFGPSRASHLSKHPSHRFARTPLPESIKEEPEDEHQTQPESPILRPIARPTKGEVREVDSEAEEESSRRSNAKGRTSRPSPDTGPIRTSQGRRPSQTSQVQGKKPSTLRSMGPSRASHLSKHPSDRFLRTLLPESIKEEPEDEHQTQEARHMDAASTEEEGIPSDDALLQEDLASFFEGSEDGNLERMAHSGFLHRSGVAEDTRRTTRTLRGEGEGVPPPPPPPIPPPPPPVLPPTFMQQPSFGRVPFSEVKLKRPSIFLPVLLDEEKHFHELVASGNLSKVQDFLERRPDFNINCTNHQGVSALHIAVERGDEEMTEYLLADPRIEAGDTHLFAIRDGRPVILRLLLDRLQAVDPSLEYMAISGSAEFPETLTPLILAAESGHYDVISMLLDRGHRIPLPHPPRCFCKEECQVLFKTQDPLTLSTGKLHIYRAISNPAYICQTSEDPFLTAFLLSRELKDCGDFDVIYLRQYEDLAEAVRLFAVDLIAECRSVDETEIILSERKGFQASKLALFPRLIMAVDFKQKEFVAHPNVQKVLERAWRGDWLGWVTSKKYAKVLYVLPRMVMLPVILCLMMFAPTSTWARHYALPVNKLLSSIASYSVFLLLIFVQSNIDKAKQTRDTKPSGVEIFLLIYIIAFIYNSVRSIILETPKRYFSFMWNIHEVLMELLFVLTFIFWITAAIRTTATGEKDVERKYWKSLDPELIAEGLFVLAAIMAYVKILLICQMSYDLGPLQVSLGKMMNDCALYSVIFAIILLAFTVGLCKFYSYYVGMYQKNPETGEIDSKQEDSFVTILDTFKTLFWGIFGMSSYEVADVVIEPIKVGEEDEINEHLFTEAVGYLVFAVFMVLSVTIILNMLVATMSNTYQAVRDNVDTEWAFGRTEVKLAYLDLPVLPPPFNIIPTTRGLVNLFKGAKTTPASISTKKDVEIGLIGERKEDDYTILVSILVQRYFSTKGGEMSTSAGWDGVLDGIINEENCDRPNPEMGSPGDCGSSTIGIAFLLSYLVISFLIVINMYIAVILENYSQATEDVQEGLTDDDYDMYYEIWQQFDPDGTQYIRYEQLSEFLDVLEPPLQIHKPNKYKIVSMDIPICKGDMMFCVDILDALTKDFFARKGNPIEETAELGEVAPGRPDEAGYEPVSSTLWRQREEYCARLIQTAWRRHKQARQTSPGSPDRARDTAVLVESDGFITKNGHKVVIHSRSPSSTSRLADV